MADSPTTTTEVIKNQLAKYSPEKLRILARRLSKEKSAPRREQIQRSEPGCNSFPLSYAQEGFWFLEQLTPANPALSWQFAFRMQMPMDAQLWKLGFKKLAERHATLRTRYMIRDGSPVQVVESEIELPVEVVDFTDMSPQEREEAVTRTLKADNLGFHVDAGPLWRAKLMKLTEDAWVLSGAIHHSIVDAWSSTVFVGELATITTTLASGQPLRMTELPIQYGDYAKWQRGWLQGKAVQDLVAWWKQQLHGIVDSQLPLDHPRPPAQRLRQGAESVLLPKRLGDRVREFSRRAGATPFMTYFAAFKTLLMRYSGQTDLAVMVPSANRERIELEGMIGLFVNTLIVRTDLANQPTFGELVGRVRQSMVASLSHQDLPFEMLVRQLGVKRELDRNPVCQVSFQLEDIPPNASPSLGGRPAITPIEVETGASVYDLNLHLFESWDNQMIERPEGTRAVMFYDPELFESETIRRMLDCYVVLLDSAMSSPDTNVCELQMISQFDQHRYCVEWNQSRKQYTEATIPERFEELAESNPEHVAIESAERALTRRELNESANRLARHLRLIGVGPDCPVAVAATGIDAIIAMLAIWKAGGCVVVLATEEVGARWKATLQLTKTPLTITQTVFRDKLSDYDGKVVVLEDVWGSIARHSTTNLRKLPTGQNLAFILPAGRTAILVEHHSAVARVEWLNTQHALKPGDGVLHSSSLAVDGGVQDILWGLLGRGRLVIADDERCSTANELDRLIRQKNAHVAHLSAETISDLLTLPFETSSEALPLRWLLCTSDRPSSSLLQAAADRFQCPVCHIYAPPEAATAATVTYYRPGDSASGALTQRTGNVSVYVLEPSLQLTPPGMTGEIYLAGKNLARGYLEGSQEAQGFPVNPFSPDEKLFRTAEFARTRNDGTLQLLGSGFGHSWRHGQRVEADEIAIALQQESTVADCTVLALETTTATRLLVAYVVTDGLWSEERLQAHLQSMLPEWMLPDVYVRVSRIPLLPTGKIDHKQLAAIELIDEKVAASWEAQLLAEPKVQHAAVLVKEEVEEMAQLFMDDLTEATPKKAAPDHSLKLSASSTPRKADPMPNRPAAVSLAEGGPLGETKFRILPELMENASRRESSIGITYLQADGSEISCSYTQLLDNAQRVLAGLRHHGLQPGASVIFQLDRNSDFVAAFWGCVLGGYVPVPISIAPTYKSANAVTSKLVHASEMLNRPLVLSSQPLAQLVADSARFHEAESFPVVKIEDLLQFQPDHNWHNADPKDVVLMLLTSGSTGKPKAVQLCHRNLIAMSTAAARMNDFTENDVSLNWMPLDHVGGIVMFHVRDVLLGCRQLHADTSTVLQNPLRWLDWIDKYRVTITWAPNFAFGLINDRVGEISGQSWNLSCLRFILNAGEAIVARTARNFLKLLQPFGLPGTAMHPAWGMSETSSAVVFSKRFLLETTNDDAQFVEVGYPIAGTGVRVVDSLNQLVPEGQTGQLQFRGETLTSGYHLRPDLNQEAFHQDGWFETGDLAYMHDGQLTIAGRLKDVIIVNGVNYHCHEIESVVEDVEGVEVSYTAAFSARPAGSNTDKVVVLFNAQSEGDITTLIQNIRVRIVQKIGVQPDFVVPVGKELIPKTSIGKIQRSQLKQQFEAGEFEPIVREFERKTESRPALPDWFYRAVWRRRDLDKSGPLSPGTYVVFMDSAGIGTALTDTLSRQGCNFICIEPGHEFAKLGPARYTINIGRPEQYRSLIECLRAEKMPLSEFIHLWTYREYDGEITDLASLHDRLEFGVYSLLYLAQALEDETRNPVRLTVVSSHVQSVDGAACIAPERASIPGLLKTMGKEQASVACRHVDLPMQGDKGYLAELILSETRSFQGEDEVAYAGGHRFVSRLEKVEFTPPEKRAELPLVTGGGYVVVGGLGGVGALVAGHLLRNHEARILLMGRSPLPDRTAWDEIKRHKSTLAERIRAFEELEQFGDVTYEAVDICNEAGMRQAIDKAELRWGSSAAGIIHSAGVLCDRLLKEETQASFAEVLVPKLYGAAVLHRIAKERPGSLFISFSSVNGFFGGVGMGAYAAANSALEAFTTFQQSTCKHLQTHCLSWSMWAETGMSRAYHGKQASRARGFATITPQQGIDSLLVALHYRLKNVLIGLDQGSMAIQRHLTTGSAQVRHLHGYFESSSDSNLRDRLCRLQVRDRLGKPVASRLLRMEPIPLTENGEVDRQQLQVTSRETGNQTRNHVSPRTDHERDVAAIWSEVLGIRNAGIHDDFFASGGNSMSAVQLMARIHKRFDRDLPLRTLFEGPTVAHLAATLERPIDMEQSSLAAIQTGGSKRPLFLVHPAGGNALCYQELARELGSDQPLYGLEEPGIRAGGLEYLNVEQMAARYCQAIQSVQPAGPYQIGGWSMGGVVAFEMARKLNATGHIVDFLAIFDVEAPHGAKTPDAQTDATQALISLCKMLEIYVGRELPISESKIAALVGDQQIDYVYQCMKEQGMLAPEIDSTYFRRYLKVHENNVRAMWNYVPGEYRGPITLFRSREMLSDVYVGVDNFHDATLGWQKHSPHAIAVHKIPGNHITMMSQPNVASVAKLLNDCISAMQPDNTHVQ